MRVEPSVLQQDDVGPRLVPEEGYGVWRHGRADARKRVPHLLRLTVVIHGGSGAGKRGTTTSGQAHRTGEWGESGNHRQARERERAS